MFRVTYMKCLSITICKLLIRLLYIHGYFTHLCITRIYTYLCYTSTFPAVSECVFVLCASVYIYMCNEFSRLTLSFLTLYSLHLFTLFLVGYGKKMYK